MIVEIVVPNGLEGKYKHVSAILLRNIDETLTKLSRRKLGRYRYEIDNNLRQVVIDEVRKEVLLFNDTFSNICTVRMEHQNNNEINIVTLDGTLLLTIRLSRNEDNTVILYVRMFHDLSRLRQHLELVLHDRYIKHFVTLRGTRRPFKRHDILLFRSVTKLSPYYWIDVVEVEYDEEILGKVRHIRERVPCAGTVIVVNPLPHKPLFHHVAQIVRHFVENVTEKTTEQVYKI